MVTKSDSINTLEFNSFYTIIPNSDFLSKEKLKNLKTIKKKGERNVAVILVIIVIQIELSYQLEIFKD